MGKIIFEKYDKYQRLDGWTRIFDSIEDLLLFIKSNKEYLLGEPGYRVEIREVGD